VAVVHLTNAFLLAVIVTYLISFADGAPTELPLRYTLKLQQQLQGIRA
jgi:hypothetical protein